MPTSAVHVEGSSVTVRVLPHGTVTEVNVTRGAVGTEAHRDLLGGSPRATLWSWRTSSEPMRD